MEKINYYFLPNVKLLVNASKWFSTTMWFFHYFDRFYVQELSERLLFYFNMPWNNGQNQLKINEHHSQKRILFHWTGKKYKYNINRHIAVKLIKTTIIVILIPRHAQTLPMVCNTININNKFTFRKHSPSVNSSICSLPKKILFNPRRLP